jgi:hypothetical protein
VSVGASWLAVLALLAFAVSLVAFLYRTSTHRSSRAWAVATGGFLVLVLLFGGISNALSRHTEPTSGEGPSSASHGTGQTDHDATVEVTRVVDGDTIDISPSVEGRSRVRLIGMDTPEVYFGTQPYGPEASAFTKRPWPLPGHPEAMKMVPSPALFSHQAGLFSEVRSQKWPPGIFTHCAKMIASQLRPAFSEGGENAGVLGGVL